MLENIKTALITGASAGIGEAFAQRLAQEKIDLFLVARSDDKLQQLATQLSKEHGVRVEFLAQDLTDLAATDHVFDQIQALGWPIDLLINNAGFGDYGEFADSDRHKQLSMIQLNILALVDLTYQFLPGMQARGNGNIINLSSIGGFQPIPYMSVYSASKAFVLSFSEALWAENRDRGIKIQALCPGPTETEFFKVAGFDQMPNTSGSARSVATPQAVVNESLRGLKSNQSVVVTGGLGNQVIVNAGRFLPREVLAKGIAQIFDPKSKQG
ncbi:Estradiol 17-beta-dehydrogenase [Thalassoporum mexicanum PCC 7367]|uniref:SDR family NAD(P)-dependent oxidoreductase n=1 Tax=Thalassoporum mexicanum TaxID=3457544 RepID=UPI00029FD7EB|nr:SDR family oxidoreductase [Pseudanabaena sp. PCC 7367]AFY68776.1 Estradiol 17-beta-dehydrogenase [Pseudanabaena sp. PCC 7367]